MPYPVRQVRTSLVQKGFLESDRDHKFYHFLHRGKDIGISTKISHGETEIPDSLASRMRRQMKLRTKRDFDSFVECPMSDSDYLNHLRDQGLLSE